jgi:ankyrin repeat protein
MLIKEGEDINIGGGELGTLLQTAVAADNINVAMFLLDNGANVNALGGRFGTAMAAAITLQNREMISLLLRYGADVTLYPPHSPFQFYWDSEQAAWDGYGDRFTKDRFNAIQACEAADPDQYSKAEFKAAYTKHFPLFKHVSQDQLDTTARDPPLLLKFQNTISPQTDLVKLRNDRTGWTTQVCN